MIPLDRLERMRAQLRPPLSNGQQRASQLTQNTPTARVPALRHRFRGEKTILSMSLHQLCDTLWAAEIVKSGLSLVLTIGELNCVCSLANLFQTLCSPMGL